MALCTVCKGIPTDFFGPLPPNFFSPSDRLFHYRHHTPSALRQSAAKGCPMCKILGRCLNDHWLSQETKDKERLTMKRAILDPEQGFGLWIGQDDISHNCFFVVPPKYQQALPTARIDENDNEDLLMRYWINDCFENHGPCHENDPTDWPTRLLDVVRFWSSGDIVLVELERIPNERISYTTLSHCWGASTSGPLTTTRANLASRKERIRFDELPLTLRDAVTITRKLKIPYLWIDSLCIIQDSPSDWENEAAKMATVYAGSVCTLSALGSQDSNGGFFRVAEKKRNSEFRYDLNLGSQRIRVFPCEPNGWVLAGPLMKRAWTLQERELSNRILHFPRGELLWQCKTLRASSDLPWLEYRAYDSDPAPKLLCDSAEEASDQHYYSFKLRRHWFLTVEGYSQRNLTYGKDKLIALSGLAHYYDYEREVQSGAYYDYHFNYHQGEQRGEYVRGKYVAGLWEDDMPSALLWQTQQYPPNMTQAINASHLQPPQRPSEYRAPSWSWASVDAHISYDSQMLDSDAEYSYGGIWLPDDPSSPRESSEYDFGAFHVQEIETIKSSPDPMGAVCAGHITLTGLVATAIIDEETRTISKGPYESPSTYTWLLDQDLSVVGALLADVQTEVRPYDEIYCVSVRDEQDGAEVRMPEELDKVNYRQVGDGFERSGMAMGLGLTKIRQEEQGAVFRRLGLIRWVRKELFFGEDISTIKIV